MGKSAAAQRLSSFVERIERLEEEKRAIAEDVKAVYGEAKSQGYNVKVLRQVIKLRRTEKGERNEWFSLIDLYLRMLGMSSLQVAVDAGAEDEPRPNPKGKGGGGSGTVH